HVLDSGHLIDRLRVDRVDINRGIGALGADHILTRPLRSHTAVSGDDPDRVDHADPFLHDLDVSPLHPYLVLQAWRDREEEPREDDYPPPTERGEPDHQRGKRTTASDGP